ncbi:hypothetical protein H6F90_08050 [Trichocoleus sp. FACHB-591]|uniref:hypothetical protein n=1 Tax=Trichocoleus sp. FACHB-591 TaxID=2692872 RepID=UPI001684F004|nr:hypothetical protein [Trichocoleus sp. FACHB-591]MBD2095105.1 hypothetical protein [Trichocoleus sp. FACHB-591]
MNQQLELPLWDSLRAAQIMPEQANLGELLGQIEVAIAQAPEPEQLQVAGEALLRVAELCAVRAEVLITEWEEAYRDPVVESGFFADVVRQTMSVDLGELMEPAPPHKRRAKRSPAQDVEPGSIAALVDKDVLLEWLEEWAVDAGGEKERQAEADLVWAIAHEEAVAEWSQAISQCLRHREPRISLQQLYRGLGMPWVNLWLGLLLGDFELEQPGEFYGSDMWITVPAPQKALLQVERM